MKRYATIALAALLLSALAPRPAAAFRDCCIVHTVGASMSTISVVEMSPGDLEEWAGRLGFSAEPRAEDGVTQIHLEASTLLSLAAPGTPFLGLPALRIRPSVTPIMVCTTQGRTWWPPVRSPSVPHANGASRILDCFAVAASAEGAAQEFKANPLCRGFGRDERCAEDAAEGATECGFEVDEWRVRVLVPEDSTGIAARWLDEETAGWIGIVVDVRDLLLAELALKAQGTEFERIETARGAGLLVDDRPRADRPVRSGALAQLGSVHSLASRWQERSPNVPGLICYPCARSEPPNSLDEFFVAIPEESRMSSRLLDGARETRAGGAKRVFRKGSRDAPRDDRCREARRSKSRVL